MLINAIIKNMTQCKTMFIFIGHYQIRFGVILVPSPDWFSRGAPGLIGRPLPVVRTLGGQTLPLIGRLRLMFQGLRMTFSL